MRTLLTLACGAALLGGCAIIVTPNDGDFHVYSAFDSQAVEGNGVVARDARAVPGVRGLEVGGAMVVDVRVGPAPSLLVEADGNLLPLIRTEARGDTLRISTERPLRSRNPIHITYTVPHLTDLATGGSGRVTVVGLNGEPLAVRRSGSGLTELDGRVERLDARASGSGNLDAHGLESGSAQLHVSGSGSMTIGRIGGDYADIDLSGSGRVRASGAVRSLKVHVSGSGSAELSGLGSEQADLATSGSGSITANVKQSLVAQSSGSGGVRVYGNPAQRTISGKSVHLMN
ncbi:MAG: head GIN domain-containing protein [Massilia sp.]